ncbi:adenylate/guanylate cyclase domain-containing protein [Mycolicibacterium cosmeticum]|uniref:Adenylate cyclase n=1 Tax=Mycolicibacterium cosmeticum TaxID=258533 RepID=W9ALC9_MYCCO|nr:adenylate/guanylate cyclase domain-containing protein [Mycolicibacterium cosmeticum]TLH69556.1 adenylate/guanylate cyclase domain-containing protein [Mycolicibacterium cosmeticum]CDO06283.1 adenylate cyclase [Mycolicibacterium cosmeticum]
MTPEKTVAQRLGRVLEKVTRQSGRMPATPEYGSWILGRVSETQRRRRVRIQLILTAFVVGANLIGVGVALLVITVTFPVPNVFAPNVLWITAAVAPAYIALAFLVGVVWATNRVINNVRWAIEEREPTPQDQRNTFFAPWRLTRVLLVLWGAGTALLTILYGLQDTNFIPKVLLGISFPGIVVSASCYLFTEFALRPVAAQALEVGPPPRRFAPGIMGRTLTVWALGSGVPVLGILLAAIITLMLGNVTPTQFTVAVMILAAFALVFGFVLMWILSWLTATPIRVVRAALNRVEKGNLNTNLVVFDGTELGQLQRGFNAMVDGLRERERVRDLFGRHVGREVAALAEQQKPELGGEERHAAVIFVDVIGSTALVTSRPAVEVVALLNRFFAVIVDEVDRHAGLVNKFEGDAVLAVFGAPVALPNAEDEALAAARTIATRLRVEVPELNAGIGVAAGQVVAGNVGAKARFEYTVIGEPVNEAARLCEFAKSVPGHLVASSDTVAGATETERAHWRLGETVALRGLEEPTRLAVPV